MSCLFYTNSQYAEELHEALQIPYKLLIEINADYSDGKRKESSSHLPHTSQLHPEPSYILLILAHSFAWNHGIFLLEIQQCIDLL